MQPAVANQALPQDKRRRPQAGSFEVLAAIALAASVAWQLFAVILAFRHAPRFRDLFDGLGAPLPLITRTFLASYPYWGLVPLLFAALTLHALLGQRRSVAYVSALLIASFASALALHAWLQEAVYAPLYAILDRID